MKLINIDRLMGVFDYTDMGVIITVDNMPVHVLSIWDDVTANAIQRLIHEITCNVASDKLECDSSHDVILDYYRYLDYFVTLKRLIQTDNFIDYQFDIINYEVNPNYAGHVITI